MTEKIDGTNAQIFITEDGEMLVGSRTRWITPAADNHGFARWCAEHREELMKLGPGRHFGEWWGSGIGRGYGLKKGDKRLSLFNVTRWCMADEEPKRIPCGDPRTVKMQERLPIVPGLGLVPELMQRVPFESKYVDWALDTLAKYGSRAAPGFMRPEGIVCFHVAANCGFKKTLERDDAPKSLSA
ncbi:MAG TPA: RNA ligase family protein [Candidatus Synoicihabitans sp.]|nr:RNA ligase family protein [Candidatus Synoicihabitans sp.]